MKREEKIDFKFWDLSIEVTDNKTMEVNGSNKNKDNVEIRAKDETTEKISLLPPILNIMLPMSGGICGKPSLFGGMSGKTSRERSMTVDVMKKN